MQKLNHARAILLTVILLCGGIFAQSICAAEMDARTKTSVEAIEKLLPELERAADDCESALKKLDLKQPQVACAADNAILRIEAVRSLRSIIARDPSMFVWHLAESQLQQIKEGMEYFLACATSGVDPFEHMTHGVRAVRSRIDGQLLFYSFMLPKGYASEKKYPLQIDIHAGAALIWRATWMDGKPGSDGGSDDGCISVSPCGRGNNSYAAMGEVAILEALDDIKKNYSIDEDRVYIGGASMGGTGGFRLATLHPDLFAAAHSLTGGAFYGVPQDNGRFDAMLLVDNLCNTGMLILDATSEGHYQTNHKFSDDMRERAKRYPGNYPLLELTDPKGAHGIIDKELIATGNKWLVEQKRNSHPRRVVYKTYNLRYDGAYWAHIDTVIDTDKPARIEAEMIDAGMLRVNVENVNRFHLDLNKELVGGIRELSVSIGGAPAIKAATGSTAYFFDGSGTWNQSRHRYPNSPVKKHGLSGPVQDVFMGEPVLMVYGTLVSSDRTKAQSMIDGALVTLFGPSDGGSTLHSAFERRADKELSKDDIAGKNLILFGTPKQNSIIRDIAAKLPVKFLDDGVDISGKEYRGVDAGLIMAYPNPLNPERYVLILPENFSAYTAENCTSTYNYPDFIVARPVSGYGGNHLSALVEGSFDSNWQLKGK